MRELDSLSQASDQARTPTPTDLDCAIEWLATAVRSSWEGVADSWLAGQAEAKTLSFLGLRSAVAQAMGEP